MKNRLHIKCDCFGHAFEMEHDKEFNELNFTIWNLGFSRPMCWKQRLRWCWHVMWTGQPWGDYVTVNLKQHPEILDELKNFVGSMNDE